MSKGIAGAMAAVVMLTACYGTPITMAPPVAGKKIDESSSKIVESESCGAQILLFIPMDVNERHKRAFRKLQDSAFGWWLTDVEIKESWTYIFVGTMYCTRMRAKAYRYL